MLRLCELFDVHNDPRLHPPTSPLFLPTRPAHAALPDKFVSNRHSHSEMCDHYWWSHLHAKLHVGSDISQGMNFNFITKASMGFGSYMRLGGGGGVFLEQEGRRFSYQRSLSYSPYLRYAGSLHVLQIPPLSYRLPLYG